MELMAASFHCQMGQCPMQTNTPKQLEGKEQGFLGGIRPIPSVGKI